MSTEAVRQFIAGRTLSDEHREDVVSGDYDHTEWFGHIRVLMAATPSHTVDLSPFRRPVEYCLSEATDEPTREAMRSLLALIDSGKAVKS